MPARAPRRIRAASSSVSPPPPAGPRKRPGKTVDRDSSPSPSPAARTREEGKGKAHEDEEDGQRERRRGPPAVRKPSGKKLRPKQHSRRTAPGPTRSNDETRRSGGESSDHDDATKVPQEEDSSELRGTVKQATAATETSQPSEESPSPGSSSPKKKQSIRKRSATPPKRVPVVQDVLPQKKTQHPSQKKTPVEPPPKPITPPTEMQMKWFRHALGPPPISVDGEPYYLQAAHRYKEQVCAPLPYQKPYWTAGEFQRASARGKAVGSKPNPKLRRRRTTTGDKQAAAVVTEDSQCEGERHDEGREKEGEGQSNGERSPPEEEGGVGDDGPTTVRGPQQIEEDHSPNSDSDEGRERTAAECTSSPSRVQFSSDEEAEVKPTKELSVSFSFADQKQHQQEEKGKEEAAAKEEKEEELMTSYESDIVVELHRQCCYQCFKGVEPAVLFPSGEEQPSLTHGSESGADSSGLGESLHAFLDPLSWQRKSQQQERSSSLQAATERVRHGHDDESRRLLPPSKPPQQHNLTERLFPLSPAEALILTEQTNSWCGTHQETWLRVVDQYLQHGHKCGSYGSYIHISEGAFYSKSDSVLLYCWRYPAAARRLTHLHQLLFESIVYLRLPGGPRALHSLLYRYRARTFTVMPLVPLIPPSNDGDNIGSTPNSATISLEGLAVFHSTALSSLMDIPPPLTAAADTDEHPFSTLGEGNRLLSLLPAKDGRCYAAVRSDALQQYTRYLYLVEVPSADNTSAFRSEGKLHWPSMRMEATRKEFLLLFLRDYRTAVLPLAKGDDAGKQQQQQHEEEEEEEEEEGTKLSRRERKAKPKPKKGPPPAKKSSLRRQSSVSPKRRGPAASSEKTETSTVSADGKWLMRPSQQSMDSYHQSTVLRLENASMLLYEAVREVVLSEDRERKGTRTIYRFMIANADMFFMRKAERASEARKQEEVLLALLNQGPTFRRSEPQGLGEAMSTVELGMCRIVPQIMHQCDVPLRYLYLLLRMVQLQVQRPQRQPRPAAGNATTHHPSRGEDEDEMSEEEKKKKREEEEESILGRVLERVIVLEMIVRMAKNTFAAELRSTNNSRSSMARECEVLNRFFAMSMLETDGPKKPKATARRVIPTTCWESQLLPLLEEQYYSSIAPKLRTVVEEKARIIGAMWLSRSGLHRRWDAGRKKKISVGEQPSPPGHESLLVVDSNDGKHTNNGRGIPTARTNNKQEEDARMPLGLFWDQWPTPTLPFSVAFQCAAVLEDVLCLPFDAANCRFRYLTTTTGSTATGASSTSDGSKAVPLRTAYPEVRSTFQPLLESITGEHKQNQQHTWGSNEEHQSLWRSAVGESKAIEEELGSYKELFRLKECGTLALGINENHFLLWADCRVVIPLLLALNRWFCSADLTVGPRQLPPPIAKQRRRTKQPLRKVMPTTGHNIGAPPATAAFRRAIEHDLLPKLTALTQRSRGQTNFLPSIPLFVFLLGFGPLASSSSMLFMRATQAASSTLEPLLVKRLKQKELLLRMRVNNEDDDSQHDDLALPPNLPMAVAMVAEPLRSVVYLLQRSDVVTAGTGTRSSSTSGRTGDGQVGGLWNETEIAPFLSAAHHRLLSPLYSEWLHVGCPAAFSRVELPEHSRLAVARSWLHLTQEDARLMFFTPFRPTGGDADDQGRAWSAETTVDALRRFEDLSNRVCGLPKDAGADNSTSADEGDRDHPHPHPHQTLTEVFRVDPTVALQGYRLIIGQCISSVARQATRLQRYGGQQAGDGQRQRLVGGVLKEWCRCLLPFAERSLMAHHWLMRVPGRGGGGKHPSVAASIAAAQYTVLWLGAELADTIFAAGRRTTALGGVLVPSNSTGTGTAREAPQPQRSLAPSDSAGAKEDDGDDEAEDYDVFSLDELQRHMDEENKFHQQQWMAGAFWCFTAGCAKLQLQQHEARTIDTCNESFLVAIDHVESLVQRKEQEEVSVPVGEQGPGNATLLGIDSSSTTGTNTKSTTLNEHAIEFLRSFEKERRLEIQRRKEAQEDKDRERAKDTSTATGEIPEEHRIAVTELTTKWRSLAREDEDYYAEWEEGQLSRWPEDHRKSLVTLTRFVQWQIRRDPARASTQLLQQHQWFVQGCFVLYQEDWFDLRKIEHVARECLERHQITSEYKSSFDGVQSVVLLVLREEMQHQVKQRFLRLRETEKNLSVLGDEEILARRLLTKDEMKSRKGLSVLAKESRLQARNLAATRLFLGQQAPPAQASTKTSDQYMSRDNDEETVVIHDAKERANAQAKIAEALRRSREERSRRSQEVRSLKERLAQEAFVEAETRKKDTVHRRSPSPIGIKRAATVSTLTGTTKGGALSPLPTRSTTAERFDSLSGVYGDGDEGEELSERRKRVQAARRREKGTQAKLSLLRELQAMARVKETLLGELAHRKKEQTTSAHGQPRSSSSDESRRVPSSSLTNIADKEGEGAEHGKDRTSPRGRKGLGLGSPVRPAQWLRRDPDDIEEDFIDEELLGRRQRVQQARKREQEGLKKAQLARELQAMGPLKEKLRQQLAEQEDKYRFDF